ncbi:MAG: hypothetical protein K2X09_00245, partial [Rickettsiales bacterium]|nr:hypothetical protein [Rickettsiales bacterium]
MGERTDLPKIKPDEPPSIINYQAGEGAFWGNLAGSIISLTAPAKYRIANILGGTAIGAIWGGLNGKSKQESEAISGKIVKTPSYWNSGLAAGSMAGWAIHTPLRYLFKTGLTSKTKITLAAISEVGGAVVGSILRKDSLQRDFDKAVAIRDANHDKTRQLIEAAVASTQAPTAPATDEAASFKNSVTPEEATALLEKQAQAPTPTIEKPAPARQIE